MVHHRVNRWTRWGTVRCRGVLIESAERSARCRQVLRRRRTEPLARFVRNSCELTRRLLLGRTRGCSGHRSAAAIELRQAIVRRDFCSVELLRVLVGRQRFAGERHVGNPVVERLADRSADGAEGCQLPERFRLASADYVLGDEAGSEDGHESHPETLGALPDRQEWRLAVVHLASRRSVSEDAWRLGGERMGGCEAIGDAREQES